MKLHFVGIGGTAMGSLAIACSNLGHIVTGSDTAVYPPMSDVLHSAGIRWYDGYDADKLVSQAPDRVIIGNAISRGNPELEVVLNNRIPMTSMAALVGELFIDRNTSIVVSGTHGKTTTSAITAWLLEHAGRQPGFFIGGVLAMFSSGCRPVPTTLHNTPSGIFVSEGDEYDTAFFDKRSKFVHYRPTIAIVNNIEFDHADIFPDLDAIVRSFEHLVRIVPSNGVVLVNADDTNALRAANHSFAPMQTVGLSADAFWRIEDVQYDAEVTSWTLVQAGVNQGSFRLRMPGEHNMRNATMAAVACVHAGVEFEQIQRAMPSFTPPQRRLQVIATWRGAVVIDDFAHHPTAIAATISALRQRYPTANLHVCFEPRSNTTTRSFFQKELAECFDGSASVCIGPVNRPERYSLEDRLDTTRLKNEIQLRGPEVLVIDAALADTSWGEQAAKWFESRVQKGDVVAVLSNGDAGGLRRLLQT